MKGEQQLKKTPTTFMHNKFFVYRIRIFFWLFCNLNQMIRVNNNSEPLKNIQNVSD